MDDPLAQAQAALSLSLQGLLDRTVDCGRVSRIAVLARQESARVVGFVLENQQGDGGWVDNEDSIWSAALLARVRPSASETNAAVRWLADNRTEKGAWGRNQRDSVRVPLTCVSLRFLGGLLGERRDWAALDASWVADLEDDIQLTYKGGFFLSCQDLGERPSDLVHRTFSYLHSQPNADGGFGPWRGHPIRSDPWSTGVCLAGLCRFPELADRDIVKRAAQWLIDTQLDSGYWPYHFIDEGTAYAYWGLSEAAKLLEG